MSKKKKRDQLNLFPYMLDEPETDGLSHLAIKQLIQICLTQFHHQPDLTLEIIH
jgi:hypothetical protein